MTKSELLWEARKRVAFSYVHKALLLGVAFCGFWALNWLIKQKDTYDQPSWRVTPGIVEVVKEATQIPACVKLDATKTFATRGELTTAMQDRAEACVWAELRSAVQDARSQMAIIAGKKPLTKDELDAYTRYANFIAREEAFASLKARAARQHVAAMLVSRDLPEKETDPAGEPADQTSAFDRLKNYLQPTLDEKSGSHVIYQILWYASLLLGVGASSMLFIVILTALPITNGEGYWTEKIGEILNRFPASANRSIAAPLLAAAIGGGTLLGAAAETQAGGQARFPSEPSTFIESPASTELPTPVEAAPWIDGRSLFVYRAGNVQNDFGGPGELVVIPLPDASIDTTEITDRLDTIHRKTEELVRRTEIARRDVVAAINDASSKIDGVERAAREAEGVIKQVQETVNITSRTTDDILTSVDYLQPVASQVERLSGTLDKHALNEAGVADAIEGRETAQAQKLTETLAQSAERDSRNVLARTFGWTLFQVGPAVPSVMTARLETKSSSKPEREALLKTLEDMRDEHPVNRWKFERLLRAKLAEPAEKPPLPHDQIDAVMRKHLPSLLRICALPRQ